MDCANVMNMFVQVHESYLLDFLRDFHKDKLGCGLKILSKEQDLYTIEIFISTRQENPIEDIPCIE